MTSPIRSLAADDHVLLRRGIAAIIASQPDMSLVAEASNGREAVEQYRTHHPDITLMDLQMGEMNGLDAIRELLAVYPRARVLILTGTFNSSYPAEARSAGAAGLILKGDDPSGYIIDATGRTISLPRGASDAALGPYHVERSKLFVLDRLAENEEVDAARIARSTEIEIRVVGPKRHLEPAISRRVILAGASWRIGFAHRGIVIRVQPNRIRCVRDQRWKYAVYLDPNGRADTEYELYDVEQDPNEVANLVDKRTGRGRTEAAERERLRLHRGLDELCRKTGMVEPPLPAVDSSGGS